MRINKLLSNYGYCSRKTANEWILEGRVHVDNIQAIEGQWVEETDEIRLDGEIVRKKASIYIALNKPPGIICTSDELIAENIISYLLHPEYIFPIGRLDKDSEGLILLTNDGDLANEILASENIHEKEYTVTVDKEISDEFLEKISGGLDIRIGKTRPCTAEKICPFSFRIILTQGMNRQIRRMCRALGYEVRKLQRIRILNIELSDLPQGSHRYLRDEEMRNLREMLKERRIQESF